MYSKETNALKLPQWQPKDHPDFLTDMNEAYRKIDKGYADNLYSHQQLEEQVSALSVDFVTVKEQVADLKEKVDKLVDLEDNPVFIELKERVDKAESDIIELQKKDVAHDDAIEVINNTLNSIEKQLDTIEEHLKNHDTEFQKHDEMIRDIKIDIAHLQDDIVDLRKHVAECETSVAEMETKVGHIEAEQIRQTEQISNLTEKVDGAVSDVNGLKDQVGFNTDKISAVEKEIDEIKTNDSAVSNDISFLKDRMDSVETTTAENAVKISELEQSDKDTAAKMSELEARVTDNESAIGDLQSDTNTLSESITEARTTANSALEGVTQNSREIGNLTTVVNSNAQNDIVTQEKVNDLEGRVTTLENASGEPGDEVTTEEFNALKTRVETTESDINSMQIVDGEFSVRIASVETKTTELETEVTTISSTQNTISEQVTSLQNDTTQLQTITNELKSKLLLSEINAHGTTRTTMEIHASMTVDTVRKVVYIHFNNFDNNGAAFNITSSDVESYDVTTEIQNKVGNIAPALGYEFEDSLLYTQDYNRGNYADRYEFRYNLSNRKWIFVHKLVALSGNLNVSIPSGVSQLILCNIITVPYIDLEEV